MSKKFLKTGSLLAALVLICAAGVKPASAVTVDIVSTGAQDGYVTATGTGGSGATNTNTTTNAGLRIGDSELFFLFFDLLPDRGVRSILSFGTNAVPPNATITAASLFLTRGGGSGVVDAPFGAASFSVKTGQFGTSANVEVADFLAAPTATGGALSIGGADGTQTENALTGPALAAVNKSGGVNSGITQVKLQYANLTNNDRTSDYVGFYAGDAATVARRPFLRVTYTVPNGADLVASPGNVDFFDVDVDAGPAAGQLVTITNLGATAVSISSVTLTGANSAEFSLSGDSGETSLAQNASRTVTVGFDPSSPGAKTAAITIANSLPSSPLTVPLAGFGSRKRIDVNFPDLNFGIQLIEAGPTFARSVVITNSGNTNLTINDVFTTGTDIADFLIQNDTGEDILVPSGTRTFDVVFDPNFPVGSKSATLFVLSDATNAPELSVPLTGSAGSGSRRAFGDFNDSGCTDIEDFLFLLDNWQLDFQGTPVDIDDFLALLDNWQLGPSCPPPAP